jgi:hypothetical protein
MTLHISYDYKCPECGAMYIPYDDEVCCPKCGLFEQERFSDFVSQAAGSALYNLRGGGSYMPAVWGSFSLADSILMFLFQMFDGYTARDDGVSFDDFATDFVRKSTFEDSEYLRDYMGVLACKVYERIEKNQADGEE